MENSSTSTLSRLSPERWPTNAFFFPLTLVTIAGAAAIGAVSAIVIIAFIAPSFGFHIGSVDSAHMKPAQTTALFIIQDLIYVPVIGFLLAVTPMLAKRTLADLGIGRPTKRDLLYGLGGATSAWIAVAVVTLLVNLVTQSSHEQKELELFKHLDATQSAVSAVTAVVIAPFAEEVVFRFLLLNILLRYVAGFFDLLKFIVTKFGSAASSARMFTDRFTTRAIMVFAIGIDGALFGLAHGQLDVALMLAACGAVLAAVYYRSGSLWSSFFAHALFNAITTAALLSHKAS